MMKLNSGLVADARERTRLASDNPGGRAYACNSLQTPLDGEAAARQQNPWDEELLNDVIDGLMVEVPDILLQLQEALRARDMPGLAAMAHRLRGPLGVLRVDTLSWLVRELERSAEAVDERRAGVTAKVLVLELQNLMLVLEDPA